MSSLRESLAFVTQDESRTRQEVIDHLEQAPHPTPEEATPDKNGRPDWVTRNLWSSIGMVKAGRRTKDGWGVWRATRDGSEALLKYPEPEAFRAAVHAAYRAWEASQKPAQRRAQRSGDHPRAHHRPRRHAYRAVGSNRRSRRADRCHAGGIMSVAPQPDPRMAILVGSIDASGVRSLEFSDLQTLADEWRTSPAVPNGVASLLATSRWLFTHSWFVYEFIAVSVAWSLVAVEAALREALAPVPERMNLKNLIGRAEREGRISREWADRLDAARQLRNGFAHADGQHVFTLGMASPVLAAAHEVC